MNFRFTIWFVLIAVLLTASKPTVLSSAPNLKFEKQDDSRYHKQRVWVDSTGKHKVEAKLIELKADQVRLKKKDGKETVLPVDRLSEDDKKFIDRYRKEVFSNLKTKIKASVYAHEIVERCQDYLEKGFADKEQTAFANEKIEEFKPHGYAIRLPKEIVTERDLAVRRKEADQMVSEWVSAKNGSDQKLLKSSINLDPTGVESAILLALYEEVHEADFKSSQRYLADGIKRGLRYQELGTDSDKTNLLFAMNNLAVSYVRSDQMSKAIRVWKEAQYLTKYDLPNEMKQNIDKVVRMMKNNLSGIAPDRNTRKEMEELAEVSGAGTHHIGGWKLLCPVDLEGKPRAGLGFVIANREAQEVVGDLIEDTRCVSCTGVAWLNCVNRKCQNGQIEVPVYGMRKVTFPDGTVQNTGRGIIRIDHVRCGTCNGNGRIDCPSCHLGIQKN